jgi:hypothetical protein
MVPYFQDIVDEFPEDLGKPASTPAAIHLFDEFDDPVLLDEGQKKMFHTVAKVLWGTIRARYDLLPDLSYLTCKCDYNAIGINSIFRILRLTRMQ